MSKPIPPTPQAPIAQPSIDLPKLLLERVANAIDPKHEAAPPSEPNDFKPPNAPERLEQMAAQGAKAVIDVVAKMNGEMKKLIAEAKDQLEFLETDTNGFMKDLEEAGAAFAKQFENAFLNLATVATGIMGHREVIANLLNPKPPAPTPPGVVAGTPPATEAPNTTNQTPM